MPKCRGCSRQILFFYNKNRELCRSCETLVDHYNDNLRQLLTSICKGGIFSALTLGQVRVFLRNLYRQDWEVYHIVIEEMKKESTKFLEDVVGFFRQEKIIWQDQEDVFRELCQEFRITDFTSNRWFELITLKKIARDITNGKLPTVAKPQFPLDVSEICHFEIEASYQKEPGTFMIGVPGKLVATNRKLHFYYTDVRKRKPIEGHWQFPWTKITSIEARKSYSSYIHIQSSIKRGSGCYFLVESDIAADILNGIARLSYKTNHRRESIPDDVKLFVWQRDGGRCVKCGSQEKLEFDHIIPISKGGSNTARNIQLLCEKCNRSKGAEIV